MNKRHWKVTAVVILILAVVVFMMLFISTKGKMPVIEYSEFYHMVEKGEVNSAEVSKMQVKFKLYNSELLHQTDNPQTPDFIEFLLLHNVKVTMKTAASDILFMIIESIFILLFLSLVPIIFLRFRKNKTVKVVKHVPTKFKDVVGMDNLKEEFYQIMNVMKNSEKYQKQGMHMPKGVLLEGAPGNGKILFAKAVAGESSVNFIPAKATDFESMLMAVGPMKVKQLFRLARKHKPCIIFIDEFDGIGTKRSYGQTAMETENTRIVTALLNELDGFAANDSILVLAATNNKKALDEALIRPGRFDRKCTVPYPDLTSRIALIEMYTKNKKLAFELQPKDLAKQFEKYSCAKIAVTLNQAALIAERKGSVQIGKEEITAAIQEVNG